MRSSWNPFIRFPVFSLAAALLACIPLLLPLRDFKVSSESKALLQGDQRNLASYEKVMSILREEVVLVLSLEYPDLFTAPGLDAVRRISEAFLQQDGVMDVKSLTHSVKPVRRGFTFEMVPLVPPAATPADLAQLKVFALEHPLMRNIMVAPDARHTILMVTYRRALESSQAQEKFHHEVEAILAPFRAEGLSLEALAVPLIEHEVRTTLRRDLVAFLPAVTTLLAAILWFTFRSWRMLLLVLASELFALLLLPGLIAGTGRQLNVFSAILLPLLAGVQLTLLAHLCTSYQNSRSIHQTWAEVFKASLFAAVTTAIGFFSFLLTDVDQIRSIGVLGAWGVGLVFFVSFGPAVAALSAFGHWFAASGRLSSLAGTFPWSDAIARVALDRRWLIFSLAALASISAVLGITRIRTDVRAVEFLGRDSNIRRAVESFDRTYGGINIVQIEFDTGVTNGVNQVAFLKYLEQVEGFARAQPHVSAVYSYSQLMAMMNQIWEGERPGSLRVPENALLLNVFILALQSKGYPFLNALADGPGRTAYLIVRTQDMPAKEYLRVIDRIVQEADRTRPAHVTVSAARGIHTILEADQRIIRSQISTAGLTVASIVLVLCFLWRSVWLALASVTCNLLPVAFMLGIAGWMQTPLNSITVMVAAIAFGIAVDDSVHFLTFWRDQRGTGLTAAEAVARVYAIKGRAIIVTSLILIAIFGLFGLSSFPPVVDFGWLTALAIALALLSVLFLLPALLLLPFPENKTRRITAPARPINDRSPEASEDTSR